MARIEFQDESAVVIIGSGAGGGTLAHELTTRGIKVVVLEAGKRQSTASFSQVPGAAFLQLTWLDPRTQSGDWGVAKNFPTLPVWHCKTVGGTTVHWTAATPRVRTVGIAGTNYVRQYPRHFADRLADFLRRAESRTTCWPSAGLE